MKLKLNRDLVLANAMKNELGCFRHPLHKNSFDIQETVFYWKDQYTITPKSPLIMHVEIVFDYKQNGDLIKFVFTQQSKDRLSNQIARFDFRKIDKYGALDTALLECYHDPTTQTKGLDQLLYKALRDTVVGLKIKIQAVRIQYDVKLPKGYWS